MRAAVAFPVSDPNPFRPVPVPKPRLLSPENIRNELSNVLRSDGFIHSGRMRGFLEFIIEETLAGRDRQLCEYTIGTAVFGRPESFQPGMDPIVRNDARRLRQKLFEYFEDAGRNDPIHILVPKGGYLPVFRARGEEAAAISAQQYRLSVSLVRVADSFEIWKAEQNFEFSENSAEDCLAVQFHLKSRAPLVAMPPNGRS